MIWSTALLGWHVSQIQQKYIYKEVNIYRYINLPLIFFWLGGMNINIWFSKLKLKPQKNYFCSISLYKYRIFRLFLCPCLMPIKEEKHLELVGRCFNFISMSEKKYKKSTWNINPKSTPLKKYVKGHNFLELKNTYIHTNFSMMDARGINDVTIGFSVSY